MQSTEKQLSRKDFKNKSQEQKKIFKINGMFIDNLFKIVKTKKLSSKQRLNRKNKPLPNRK